MSEIYTTLKLSTKEEALELVDYLYDLEIVGEDVFYAGIPEWVDNNWEDEDCELFKFSVNDQFEPGVYFLRMRSDFDRLGSVEVFEFFKLSDKPMSATDWILAVTKLQEDRDTLAEKIEQLSEQ